jgi:hypothetical protein
VQVDQLIAEMDQGVLRSVRARIALRRGGGLAHLPRFARELRGHPSENVRQAMVWLVVGQEELPWHQLLSRALQDDHPHVRMTAAKALATRGTTEDLDDLADCLRRALRREIDGGQRITPAGEWFVVHWSAEAVAAIAERGPAPARCWALAFLQQAQRDAPEGPSPVAPALQRLEQATKGDLPRPAGPPSGVGTHLPIPEAPPD